MTDHGDPGWLTVELHCHTCFSPDSLLRPDQLIGRARRRGLDRVAVTDHNTIQGALACAELDPARVIVGEEIQTQQGELLAYYLEEEVPAGLTPHEALRRLREQGAFISVSHPFDPHRQGAWGPQALLEILPHVDAIEGFNARSMTNAPNRRAADFARQHGVLQTVGSDAHAAWELGRATLRMPAFEGPAEMRAALQRAERVGGLSPAWVHLLSRWASWRKRLGWSPPGCEHRGR